MGRPVRIRRACAAGAAVFACLAVTAPASFAASPSPSPGAASGGGGDQVVLVGRVNVPRGQSVGEVVVFSGRVAVAGVVRGDIVVFDGPVVVSGQVSGSVVAVSGSVRLLPGAQVAGDVLAHDRAIVADDARVDGRTREDVSFTLARPLRSIALFVSWLAIALSTLLLGLAFAAIAPRALDAAARAGRTAPFASAGWGVGLAIVVPVASIVAIALVVGLPLGLALLLALFLVALVGAAATAQTVGRLLLGDGRAPALAFLAGWGVATAVGLIPLVSGVVFVLSAVFGTGTLAVATWRVRRPVRRGRHRRGAVTGTLLGDASAPGVDPRPLE